MLYHKKGEGRLSGVEGDTTKEIDSFWVDSSRRRGLLSELKGYTKKRREGDSFWEESNRKEKGFFLELKEIPQKRRIRYLGLKRRYHKERDYFIVGEVHKEEREGFCLQEGEYHKKMEKGSSTAGEYVFEKRNVLFLGLIVHT
ncbi:hypothetical protein CEXT_116361 [Caerostris extrusa]|uniref:Uncharacterized protein n=1 Tax=Caerostris extrusa TaxID=172846 RepID=A0AAV4VEN5_CAEEX|nr:hypothetical protein CEXT_116361 [Caerostris extrusa]